MFVGDRTTASASLAGAAAVVHHHQQQFLNMSKYLKQTCTDDLVNACHHVSYLSNWKWHLYRVLVPQKINSRMLCCMD